MTCFRPFGFFSNEKKKTVNSIKCSASLFSKSFEYLSLGCFSIRTVRSHTKSGGMLYIWLACSFCLHFSVGVCVCVLRSFVRYKPTCFSSSFWIYEFTDNDFYWFVWVALTEKSYTHILFASYIRYEINNVDGRIWFQNHITFMILLCIICGMMFHCCCSFSIL